MFFLHCQNNAVLKSGKDTKENFTTVSLMNIEENMVRNYWQIKLKSALGSGHL